MSSVLRGIRAVATFLAVSLCGPMAATAQDSLAHQSVLPSDAEMITDPAALRALLADRTVHAIYVPDGSNWREFSAADGRTIWDEGHCIRPGTWQVSGSAVCYRYPSWENGAPQCFIVYRSAKATHFVGLGSATGRHAVVSNAYEILDGNPDGLPLNATEPLCDDVSA
jgi:hypothetical protein